MDYRNLRGMYVGQPSNDSSFVSPPWIADPGVNYGGQEGWNPYFDYSTGNLSGFLTGKNTFATVNPDTGALDMGGTVTPAGNNYSPRGKKWVKPAALGVLGSILGGAAMTGLGFGPWAGATGATDAGAFGLGNTAGLGATEPVSSLNLFEGLGGGGGLSSLAQNPYDLTPEDFIQQQPLRNISQPDWVNPGQFDTNFGGISQTWPGYQNLNLSGADWLRNLGSRTQTNPQEPTNQVPTPQPGGGSNQQMPNNATNLLDWLMRSYDSYNKWKENSQAEDKYFEWANKIFGRSSDFENMLMDTYQNPQGWLEGPEGQALNRIVQNQNLRTDASRGNLSNDINRSVVLQDKMMQGLGNYRRGLSQDAALGRNASSVALSGISQGLGASKAGSQWYTPLTYGAGNQGQPNVGGTIGNMWDSLQGGWDWLEGIFGDMGPEG